MRTLTKLVATLGAVYVVTIATAGAAPLEKCDKGSTDKRIACLQRNIESLANNVQIKSISGDQHKCVHDDRNVGVNLTVCDGTQGPVNWQLVPQ